LSRWRLVLEARDTLLNVLVPALRMRRFLRRGAAIARALRVIRPRRPMQLSQIARIIASR
jgi:hypothetical protein